MDSRIPYRDPQTGAVNVRYISVDKIVPKSKGGDPYDPSTLRAMHFGCNSARGNGDHGSVPRTSTPW